MDFWDSVRGQNILRISIFFLIKMQSMFTTGNMMIRDNYHYKVSCIPLELFLWIYFYIKFIIIIKKIEI